MTYLRWRTKSWRWRRRPRWPTTGAPLRSSWRRKLCVINLSSMCLLLTAKPKDLVVLRGQSCVLGYQVFISWFGKDEARSELQRRGFESPRGSGSLGHSTSKDWIKYVTGFLVCAGSFQLSLQSIRDFGPPLSPPFRPAKRAAMGSSGHPPKHANSLACWSEYSDQHDVTSAFQMLV